MSGVFTTKKDPSRHALQCLLFAILFCICGRGVSATLYDRPTLVIVSMKENHHDKYWPAGEERIRDELRISNINVLVVPTTTGEETDFQEELRAVAEEKSAAASLLVYNSGSGSAHLIVYLVRGEDGAPQFTEHRFDWTPTHEEIDIAALKAADAVQAYFLSKSSNPPPPAASTKKVRFRRTSIALAVSGIASLGIAGVLQWRMSVHETRANHFGSDYTEESTYSSSYNPELTTLKNKLNDEKKLARIYQIGVISAYALGGTLIAVAGVFAYKLINTGEQGDHRISFHLTSGGIGLTGEF